MQRWMLFEDQRFSLVFKIPEGTPQGHNVERIDSQQDIAVRVHFVSRNSKEVYFEVTKYVDLAPMVEYQLHKADLERRFSDLSITDLETSHWKSFPAHVYSFRWNKSTRSVLLVKRGNCTYRILYDPQSKLNTEILSTVEWME